MFSGLFGLISAPSCSLVDSTAHNRHLILSTRTPITINEAVVELGVAQTSWAGERHWVQLEPYSTSMPRLPPLGSAEPRVACCCHL